MAGKAGSPFSGRMPSEQKQLKKNLPEAGTAELFSVSERQSMNRERQEIRKNDHPALCRTLCAAGAFCALKAGTAAAGAASAAVPAQSRICRAADMSSRWRMSAKRDRAGGKLRRQDPAAEIVTKR